MVAHLERIRRRNGYRVELLGDYTELVWLSRTGWSGRRGQDPPGLRSAVPGPAGGGLPASADLNLAEMAVRSRREPRPSRCRYDRLVAYRLFAHAANPGHAGTGQVVATLCEPGPRLTCFSRTRSCFGQTRRQ